MRGNRPERNGQAGNPPLTGFRSGNAKADHGDFSDCRGYWKTLIDRPMYDKVYTDDGQFVSYMGPYRAQNTITMNVRMTDIADPNYYPSQHEVTVKGPETRNSEAAVWLNSHDNAGIKAHVRTEFGKGPNTLLEWVAAAAKIEEANPGISTQELYKMTDAAVKAPNARFSGRGISSNIDKLTSEQYYKYGWVLAEEIVPAESFGPFFEAKSDQKLKNSILKLLTGNILFLPLLIPAIIIVPMTLFLFRTESTLIRIFMRSLSLNSYHG